MSKQKNLERVLAAVWAGILAVGLMTGAGIAPADADPAPVTPMVGGTGHVDPTWRPDGATGGSVTAMVALPDGSAVVAGDLARFDGLPVGNVVRVKADGSRDPAFSASVNGLVYALALQADGKIIIGGLFTSVNGVACGGIARLLTDGSVDVGFTAGGGITPAPTLANQTAVRSVALDSLGRVVIGGNFTGVGGVARSNIARLTAAGAVDGGFNASTNGRVDALAVQSDNKVVLAGSFTTVSFGARTGIARVSASGTLDGSFAVGSGLTLGSPSIPGQANAVLVHADGRILVGGSFDTYNGTPRHCLAKLNTDGSLNVGFNSGTAVCESTFGGPQVRLAPMPDGTVAVAVSTQGAWIQYRLLKLQANGSAIAGFTTDDRGRVGALAQAGDERLLVGGQWLLHRSATVSPLIRVSAGGALDAAYRVNLGLGVGFNAAVTALAVQPDGKTLVSGWFDSYDNREANGLARLNADGTLDTSFDVGSGTFFFPSSTGATAVLPRPDGKVIAIGPFSTFNGGSRPGIVQLQASGAVDPGFNPATGFSGGTPQAMALLGDGRLVVVGRFTTYRGAAHNGIVVIRTDGSADPAFASGVGFGGSGFDVTTVAVQPDSKIVAGGNFTSYRGFARNGIVRINTNGTLDATFNPGSGFSSPSSYLKVETLAISTGNQITVGGGFTGFNGVTRNQLARLNSSGTLDAAFNPGAGFGGPSGAPIVQALVVASDGSVVTTGDFISLQGVSRNGIAKVGTTGALDASFDPGSGFTQTGSPLLPTTSWSDIPALAMSADGRITVGGDFQAFNDVVPRPMRITRLVSGPPGLPIGVAATNGNGQALITFQMATGGVATSYQYSLDGGGWVNAVPASPVPQVVVSGLVNGVARGVRVRGVNALGVGPASASVMVLPRAPTASLFVPTTPSRVLDTRAPGGGGALTAGETRTLSLPMVPNGTVAVAYNLTAVTPSAGGHLRVQPGDASSLTPTSVVNFRPGENICNAAIVKVSPTRTVKVHAAAATHVLFDLVGYFVAEEGWRFTAITPVRVYDTTLDPAGLLPADARRLVSPRTAADGVTPVVPAGAAAVAYNITVTDTVGPGHLRVMPAGGALTPTSALNWATPGERIANASAVGLDAGGRFEVYNGSGAPVRFLVDVVGYYSAAGAEYFAIDPVRTLDTRTSDAGPIPAGPTGIRNAAAGDVGTFIVAPIGSPAVAYNATVTNTNSAGHLRLYPAGAALPNASVINWPAGGYTRANASVTQVSIARTVTLYNGSSTYLDAIVDVNGYYR